MKITREMFDEIGPFYLDDFAIDSSDQDFMYEVFTMLPSHEQHLALEWGCSDTVFRDNVFEFLCKAILDMTCEEYYASSVFKEYINNGTLIVPKNEIMEDKLKIDRIEIFDFDGTLIATPLPEEGKPVWLAKKGSEWPHKGWWSKRESLDMEVFEMPIIKEAHDGFLAIESQENVLKILMTGRITPLGAQVKAILDSKGLVFDRYEFCDTHDTLEFKLKKLSELREEFPHVTVIKMYEDREPHVDSFKKWAEAEDITFEIDLIKSER